MDLTQLANLGEFVGGIAVLVTLIYSAAQVRQGNRVARAQVHQESSRMSSELFVNADRDTLNLFARAHSEPEQISESDWRFMRAQFIAVVNYYETLFYAWDRGDVDTDIWASRRYRISSVIGPTKDHLWEPLKPAFGRRFREFADNDLLANVTSVETSFVLGDPRS
jgi:hypothetical protein